ncbi:alpha/beta hydrolase [Nocardia sp. BMG51109]|uniref:alpha/beta hydrolase n=1 Tax=Nocardia sp. BMG51109 TaxID=1056816 RepID=UPI000465EBA2|nr:alpha/beta fold hydrolase [Nocardia sp. BMG51109]
MTAELLADDAGFETVTTRVVDVDGIPMSALCAAVGEPRAVLVAVHGGATTSRYFDFPGRPWLSLLRLGARLGFTVLAVDRPGYGASAPHGQVFDPPARRVDACYRAIDALLESRPRGAGIFLLSHSAGCDLGVRMAADARGAGLLGVELAGTGLRKHADAERLIQQMRHTRSAAAVGALLWHPDHLYPPEIVGGRSISFPSPRYEAAVVRDWPADFRNLAGRVTVPVRFSHAEYERFWRSDPEALAEIRGLFRAAPRFVPHAQRGSGHNLSVGVAAAAYHLGVLSFVEECVLRSAVLDSTRSLPQ